MGMVDWFIYIMIEIFRIIRPGYEPKMTTEVNVLLEENP